MENITNMGIDEYKAMMRVLIVDTVKSSSTNDQSREAEPKLYSVKDAMQFFQVSEVTIHNWRKNRILECMRVGRRVYFTEDQINAAQKPIKINK